jgi:hypothetical protein
MRNDIANRVQASVEESEFVPHGCSTELRSRVEPDKILTVLAINRMNKVTRLSSIEDVRFPVFASSGGEGGRRLDLRFVDVNPAI